MAKIPYENYLRPPTKTKTTQTNVVEFFLQQFQSKTRNTPGDLPFFCYWAVYSPPPGTQKETTPHPRDSPLVTHCTDTQKRNNADFRVQNQDNNIYFCATNVTLRTFFCILSDKLLQIVNPVLRTLFTVTETIPVPATIFELPSANLFPRFRTL